MNRHIIYEEFGKNYRFFLTWRYGVVLAYFGLFYGLFTVTLESLKINNILSGVVLIFGSLISLFLWFADCRTREIYRRLTKFGRRYEQKIVGLEYAKNGAFSALESVRLKKPTFFSQSATVNGLFLISFPLFFYVGVMMVCGFLSYSFCGEKIRFVAENYSSAIIVAVITLLIVTAIMVTREGLSKNGKKS